MKRESDRRRVLLISNSTLTGAVISIMPKVKSGTSSEASPRFFLFRSLFMTVLAIPPRRVTVFRRWVTVWSQSTQQLMHNEP